MEDSKQKSVAIESFFVIPRNQFYWGYRINEGVLHIINKDKVFTFLKDYVPLSKQVQLSDLISRLRPFIILVEEQEIFEMNKQFEVDTNYYRKTLTTELESQLNYHKDKKESNLENKLKSFEKKLIK